jgi:hypothetical protein
MGQDADGDGIAELSNSNTVLNESQGNDMKSHCFALPPC